jgi:putative transposase
MPWTPSRLTKSQLEERRTRAFEMLEIGFRPTEIALDLNVSRQIVYLWKAAFEAHGLTGAKAKPHPGPGKNITAEQLQEFKTMILQGALIHGFPSPAWTCARAAALIETRFGLVYTADHVGVLMKELGLSPQKPDKRSMKRDETKIQVWKHETLPDLKKSSKRVGR